MAVAAIVPLIVPLLACPESVAAQAIPAPVAPVRYSIRMPDAAFVAGVGVLGAIPTLLGTKLPYGKCNPCDSLNLWPIDRSTVGLPNERISTLSTATMGATLVGAGALIALSRRGEVNAGKSSLEDIAVLAQALEVDAVLTQWSKVLFHRARPVLYTSASGQNQTVDAGRGFPSGHSSFSFAAAAAAASILARRHELSTHKLPVVLLFAGAVTTAVLRVSAHKHFPTDVAAGALLGTVVGWIVPQVHAIR